MGIKKYIDFIWHWEWNGHAKPACWFVVYLPRLNWSFRSPYLRYRPSKFREGTTLSMFEYDLGRTSPIIWIINHQNKYGHTVGIIKEYVYLAPKEICQNVSL